MRGEDLEAFRSFAVAELPRARRAAFLMCGDWHQAEDLAQSALIRVFGVWGKLDKSPPLHGYVETSLTRLWLDEKRRRARRPEIPVGSVPDTATTPAREYSANEHQLTHAMAALTPRQRSALVLRYWEGMTIRETAEAMACSEGAVKNLVSAAIRNLRSSSALEPTVRDR